jgi:leucyl-tRNA synthetase
MLHQSSWPEYDENKTVDDVIEMAVQINGKVRGKIQIAVDAAKDEAHDLAFENENIKKFVEGKQIIKEIYVPGKIYNIVAK